MHYANVFGGIICVGEQEHLVSFRIYELIYLAVLFCKKIKFAGCVHTKAHVRATRTALFE